MTDYNDEDTQWYFGVPFKKRVSGTAAAKPEPKFKVGDRVRFTDAVYEGWFFKAGETGNIVDITDWDNMGIVVSCDSHDCDTAYVSVEHIEPFTAPPFADGDRVKLKRNTSVFAIGDKGVVATADGEFVGVNMEPNGFLFYFTPDTLAADCAERKEQPEPKFKAGDVVRFKKFKDSISTIKRVKTFYGRDPDDTYSGPMAYDYESGGWDHEEDIELVPASPAQPAIVARVLDGQPRPSTIPYMHADSGAALLEAERLAKNNPGQEFAVYQRVGARVASVEYKMKEVA